MFPKINLKFLTLTALFANSVIADKAKIYRNCLKPGQFVLTFDDGPNPETTPIALDVLKKYNIKGTFFINAHNWSDLENDPTAIETVKKTYAAGHDIGSHTYNHKDLFEAIEEGSMKENVDDMTDKIEEIIGVKPAYFRPPCGNGAYNESDPHKREMSEMIQEYLGERGYNIIMWGTDTMDWQYKEDVDSVIATMNEQLADPSVSPKTHSFITLMHDVYPSTVNIVLPTVIEYVQSVGYEFVPLSECIGVSPYQSISNDKENQNNLNNGESNSTDENNKNKSAGETNTNNSTPTSNNTNSTSTFTNSTTESTVSINKEGDNTSNAITIHSSIILSVVIAILSLLF
ncbi:glycoside hydrolase/deacetylase [Neocallimastix lanati (nom. inval.)]|uniref:Glycoside hydrolase/deacetylase n=1 Tax=Neocallimastix californiae TaxID=1754190 RepID=A0A1Y2ENP5_9FUNG|nr:glycoside hydrolase/deacetylase [Neocallimastix sp. JGI-2020a]ORY73193.1 glycoside hydrolase/deacetylase [Neocallimastix californiae]|eukprot:ORY73193.1 glycoside hydrolase/deacetylase [Neocallimastix californiae]